MEAAANGGSVEADPNRNRTVDEYMQQSIDRNEQQMGLVVTDITGRIELGVDGNETFKNFLKELEKYISRDVSLLESSKGIELLQRVLSGLQPEILSMHDISSLRDLLSARLQLADNFNYRANIKDTVKCLKSLSGMKRFLKNDAPAIANSLLSIPPSVWSQQLVDTRIFVYEALQNFLDSNREYLRKEGNYGRKVIDGLTALALHEKDPSCLRVVFPLYQMLAKEQDFWGIEENDLEKIWDSFVRYYPIKIGTFGQNAWDSSKPDPLVLKQLLLQCFISNSNYAQWAFPRLLDLLDQNSDVSADVKKDVFYTLEACVRTYDVSIVEQWSGKLWDSLKFEILNGDNEEFITGAVGVIKQLAKSLTRLSSDNWTIDTNIPPFFITVVAELNERLHEPAQRFTVQCGRILGAIASANSFAFHASIKLSMGALLVIHQTLDTIPKKDHMMQLFNLLIAACPSAIQKLSKTSESRTEALRTFKVYRPSLIEVYFEAMLRQVNADDNDEVKYRVTTIEGLSLLFKVPDSYARRDGVLIEGRPVVDVFNFLSDYEKGTIVESLSGIVLATVPQDETILHAAVLAMRTTAVRDSTMFVRVTLANFLGHLPDSVSSSIEVKALLPKLNALARIACLEVALVLESDSDGDVGKSLKKCKLFHSFSDALIKKLESIFRHKGQIRYATAIVATLYHGMMLFDAALGVEYPGPVPRLYDGQPSIGQTGPYGDIIMRLYRLCIIRKGGEDEIPMYMGLRELPCGDEVVDDRFLELVAKLAAAGLSSEHTVPEYSPLNWRRRRLARKQQSESINEMSKSDNAFQQASKQADGNHTDLTPFPSEVWTLFDATFPSNIQGFRQEDCATGPKDKCSANILSMGLLAGARKQEKLLFVASDVAAQMIRNAISDTNGASHEARMSFIYALQLSVNKFEAMKSKSETHQSAADLMSQLTNDAPNLSDSEAYRIYQVLAYTTSAALLAYDRSFYQLISSMLSALAIPTRSIKVAQSFRILLAPSDIINKKHFCTMRSLAYGQLYNMTVPYIIDHFSKEVSIELKHSYLIALAAVISYMPLELLKDDAARVIPLLLAGTDVNNPGDDDRTKMDCISGLIRLIPEVPVIIEEHVDSIINRMTERTHNTMAEPSDASVECRVKALQCLNLLAINTRPLVILKRKPRVIKELDIALNDVSRTVRQAAERTKMVWFNITDEDVKEDVDEHAGHNH